MTTQDLGFGNIEPHQLSQGKELRRSRIARNRLVYATISDFVANVNIGTINV